MYKNPVRELRERLGLTQEQLANTAGISKKMIEQYEQGATGEKALSLAVLAARDGYRDLEVEFRRAAGETVQPEISIVNLDDLEPYERELASMLVSISRNRADDVRRGIIALIENEIKQERQRAKTQLQAR